MLQVQPFIIHSFFRYLIHLNIFWSKYNTWIACILCAIMSIGFVTYTRNLVTVAMVLMFVNALEPNVRKFAFERFKNNLFSLACVLFFVCFLITGLWSENLDIWGKRVMLKVPFLLIPFTFLSISKFSLKQKVFINLSFIITLLGGMIHSVIPFKYELIEFIFGNVNDIKIKLNPKVDLIRFSLMLDTIILYTLYILIEHKDQLKKLYKIIFGIFLFFAILFIHISGGRTGIVMLYGMGFLLVINKLRDKNYKTIILSILTIVGITLLCYLFIPKINFLVNNLIHEINLIFHPQAGSYKLNDVSRSISWIIGVDIIKDYPLLGTGAGDLWDILNTYYYQNYPQIKNIESFLIPHNQFIMTAASIGLPLSMSFFILILSIFKIRGKNTIYLYIISIAYILDMLWDPLLENQYGIFVFLFGISIWFPELNNQANKIKNI